MSQSFAQVDASTSRHYGGTGLGFTISKRLVEYMHGEISVQSGSGCGAAFWFSIPLELVDDPIDSMPIESISLIKDRHVLIISSRRLNRHAIMCLCQQWEMVSREVSNTAAAEELILKQKEQSIKTYLIIWDDNLLQRESFLAFLSELRLEEDNSVLFLNSQYDNEFNHFQHLKFSHLTWPFQP